MLTGFILAYNSLENTACYGPGTASALGFDAGEILCAGENGKLLGVDWAIPCSTNGVSVTGFDYQKATDGTKPRADAVKVITVQDNRFGGGYKRFFVPDAYDLAAYVAACCAGCSPIAAVTIPAPIIFYAECTLATPTIPGCVYKGSVQIAALTGANTTYTATGYGFDATGTAIVFAPATSTGTTVALLAASMQTNWAAELGGGTFVATGNNIEYTSANGARVGFTVAQS